MNNCTEATIILLDTYDSMRRPFEGSETRLGAVKKALQLGLAQMQQHKKDEAVSVFDSKSELTQGLGDVSNQLMQRVRYLETAPNEKTMDFCRLLGQATQRLRENASSSSNDDEDQKNVLHRIVLFTDAEQMVDMHTQSILVMIDQLRELQARLEVVGLNFEYKSVIVDKPAAAESAQSKKDSDEEETTTEEEGEEESCDEEEEDLPEGVVRYKLRGDKEKLLISLVEKIGGSVTAVSTLDEILECGKRILVDQKQASRKRSHDDVQDDNDDKVDVVRIRTSDGTDQWACSLCTFLNSAMDTVCKMCGVVGSGVAPPMAHSHAAVHASLPTASTSPTVPLPTSITVVSFNVAEFKPADAAPADWDPIPAFRTEILRHEPDVICLQEMTERDTQFLFADGFLCVGTTSSHCGLVAILLKREWIPQTTLVQGVNAPAVLATVSFGSGPRAKKFAFGSCHFEPFNEGQARRFEQIQEVLRHEKDTTFILGGDFNMRQREDKSVLALGLSDAWIEAGSEKAQKFSWDTRNHGDEWNCYHGPDTFQYTTRYDRIYFRGELSVDNFQLMGNKPVTNPRHFLSDHFGLTATFQISTD